MLNSSINYRPAITGEIKCKECMSVVSRVVSGRVRCYCSKVGHIAVNANCTCDFAQKLENKQGEENNV